MSITRRTFLRTTVAVGSMATTFWTETTADAQQGVAEQTSCINGMAVPVDGFLQMGNGLAPILLGEAIDEEDQRHRHKRVLL
jgi:hypothetical protein